MGHEYEVLRRKVRHQPFEIAGFVLDLPFHGPCYSSFGIRVSWLYKLTFDSMARIGDGADSITGA